MGVASFIGVAAAGLALVPRAASAVTLGPPAPPPQASTSAIPQSSTSPPPQPSPSASAAVGGTLQQIGRVVTSDRRSEPLGQTSKPTFIIDRSRIDAYGSRTVADALRDMPGFNLFSDGAFGSHVDYGIRGSRSSQTLVLVDGQPVTDPSYGAVELGQFSTIGVDRIEVVESGSSTLYGTSASAGVVNIVTRVPRGMYLEASSGSFADRDARASVGNGRLGFSYERHVATDAYPYGAFVYSPKKAFPVGTRTNAYGDQSAGRLSLDQPLGADFTVRGRLDQTQTLIGVPGRLDSLTPDASQGLGVATALLTIEHAPRAPGALNLSLTYSAVRNSLAYYDPLYNSGQSDDYTARSGVSLKASFSGSRVDGVTGVDLARESGLFSFPSTPNFSTPSGPPIPASTLGATQSQAAVYGQIGASPFAGSRFTAGLRAENDRPSGGVLAPSFGGVIRSGSLRFAGDVGESFRVPTLDDLYYPGASNPKLLPERAQTADVTIAYESRRCTLSAGWFDRNGTNFIEFDPVAFVPVNAQIAQTAGVTFTASSQLVAGIEAEVSYTDLYRALDVVTRARLAHSPAGVATLSIAHPFGATRFAYGLRYGIIGSDGDDRANVAPPLSGSFDAYDSLDAYLRFKLTAGTIVTLRGDNLGNAQYAPVWAYPAPRRRLFIEFATR